MSFHRDFRAPTKDERNGAIGNFPGAPHASKTRANMIIGSNTGEGEESSLPDDNRPSLAKSNTTAEAALLELDEPALFSQTPRSETCLAIPSPRDDLDWLANIPEEGQTFDQYIQSLTSRSGRIRPFTNAVGEDIVLLPIVRKDNNGIWPDYGPSLEKLVKYTRAFFDRNVRVLPAASISVDTHQSKKRKRKGSPDKAEFNLQFPPNESKGSSTNSVTIKGRANPKHIQLQVSSVLDALSIFRDERNEPKEFCIMAITMEDLFDAPKDLFCAGMAFGGSKVAVFSFFRYHPHLKMHPGTWHNFGYTEKSSSYSYYEDNNQNPKGLMPVPQPLVNNPEFLRRSSKLLIHELGHLYGLDHCIFNRCLMMGTGHLVEDFQAPSHLCRVCLRKLQWRLGFAISGRYALLSEAFAEMGLKKEASWAQKQHKKTKSLD
mmetsp:Transcript_19784/g.28000  ORF Transcript_19784/g.28000 Transcript_19784/m.28000 type:complete len:432 (-) Transcript_19784:176-1471(-)